jgi:hypothetical protein
MDTKFAIISICTENYRDALPVVIESWLRHADQVYLYTDFDMDYPGVTVIPTLEKTDDWLKAVAMKAHVLKDFQRRGVKHFAFVDVDCYVHREIRDVFNHDFDVAATRMNARKVANSGVWFIRNSERIAWFADEWIRLQYELRDKGIGVVKHLSPYEQISFSRIVHSEKIKAYPLSCQYNYEGDSPKEWLKGIRKARPAILHLKGRMFRDKQHVEAMHRELSMP